MLIKTKAETGGVLVIARSLLKMQNGLAEKRAEKKGKERNAQFV